MKLLVVEDNAKVGNFLSRVLSEEGFAVDLCRTREDGTKQAMTGLYDLVLLDWMLPDGDGLSACRDIRRTGSTTPIIMLTARGETQERVLGLEAGADDYIVKPFDVAELIARVRAVVRRATGFGVVRFGELAIDRVARRALVGDVPTELSPREHALVLYLGSRSQTIVRRSELISEIWGLDFDPGSNVVEVAMSRLREKLGRLGWMIETVRGVGYRLRTEPPET